MFDRRRDAGEVLHRAQADVEIEHLPQGDVEGTDAAADRRGQRPLDADQKFPERGHRVIRQPVVEFLEGLLPGMDLEPGDFPFPAIGRLNRRVKDPHAGSPDVRPRAVAANKGDDGIMGNTEFAAGDADFAAGRRGDVFIGHNNSDYQSSSQIRANARKASRETGGK